MISLERAIDWLAKTAPEDRPSPIVPHLRKEFGLSPKQSIVAIREANLRHARSN